mgnify:CR=1 FL=1
MLNNLKKVLKKKVRFVSKHPPIKSQHKNLKKIEVWLNELIENKNFDTESWGSHIFKFLDGYGSGYGLTSGSIVIKDDNDKKARCIFDASIQRKVPILFTKYRLYMQIHVVWTHLYNYEQGTKNHILEELEVPPPSFLYRFQFEELEWNKEFFFSHGCPKTVSNFVEETQFIYLPVFGKTSENNVDKNEYIHSFDTLLTSYNYFLGKVEEHLSKHNVSVWDCDNIDHPINLDFLKQKKLMLQNGS